MAMGTSVDVEVSLRSLSNGSALGTEILPPMLSPGTARAVQFLVAAQDVCAGIEVEVDMTDAVLECDEGNNVLEIPGPICE